MRRGSRTKLGDIGGSTSQQKRTLTVDEMVKAAYQLERSELERLSRAIAALLEAEEVRVQDEPTSTETRTLTDGQRGSIELKLIRGHGPYAYLRWWDGGKHRSHYLGKAKKGEE